MPETPLPEVLHTQGGKPEARSCWHWVQAGSGTHLTTPRGWTMCMETAAAANLSMEDAAQIPSLGIINACREGKRKAKERRTAGTSKEGQGEPGTQLSLPSSGENEARKLRAIEAGCSHCAGWHANGLALCEREGAALCLPETQPPLCPGTFTQKYWALYSPFLLQPRHF